MPLLGKNFPPVIKELSALFTFNPDDGSCLIVCAALAEKFSRVSLSADQSLLTLRENGKMPEVLAVCTVPEHLRGRIRRALVVEYGDEGRFVSETEVTI